MGADRLEKKPNSEGSENSPPIAVPVAVPVFRGSRAACFEFGLVLDAKGLAYDLDESGGEWLLLVAPAVADVASDELARYSAERSPRRPAPVPFIPFHGSALGAAVYAFVLILTAYCAGIQWLGMDWFEAGALESKAAASGEWWRAVTALTLHLDQEHLLGNLLFGVGIGILAARMFGPGLAWLSILLAAAAANTIDMLVSPPWHRAVGASTAVFAALGLLAGFGWGQRLGLRDRRLYRWAPLFAGVCLLALLGAGNEHVDVLGHLLGFLVGTVLGWGFARAGWPRRRGLAFQMATGSAALLVVCSAWLLALRHYR
jgi:membrane associated rhomboid family serine protease